MFSTVSLLQPDSRARDRGRRVGTDGGGIAALRFPVLRPASTVRAAVGTAAPPCRYRFPALPVPFCRSAGSLPPPWCVCAGLDDRVHARPDDGRRWRLGAGLDRARPASSSTRLQSSTRSTVSPARAAMSARITSARSPPWRSLLRAAELEQHDHQSQVPQQVPAGSGLGEPVRHCDGDRSPRAILDLEM